MKTWSELEERFRSLKKALQSSRLDEQIGYTGEYWRIAGGFNKQSNNEFELLSMLAGKLLQKASNKNKVIMKILDAEDTKVIWYRALKQYSNAYKVGPILTDYDKNGKECGKEYSGSIHDLAENSANVCLYMEINHPIYINQYSVISMRTIWNWLKHLSSKLFWIVAAAVVTTIVGLLIRNLI